MLQAVKLTCESRVNPIGLDEKHPNFGWQLVSDERNAYQSAYRVRVMREEENTPVWDSGRVESDESLYVPYEGEALEPRTRYFWQVCVWDKAGQASGWSEKAYWETGLMDASAFLADWITQPDKGDISVMQPCPMFRKGFSIHGKIVRARAYASALGIYELNINGRPVGEEVLSPGFTSYRNRVQYQTWDITGLLQEGENAVGAIVADGWYRGYLGGGNTCRNDFGEQLALICQIHILTEDGRETVVCTDESWKVHTDGAYRRADYYMGVEYDALREMPGWAGAGFDDSAWTHAAKLDHKKEILTAQLSQPVRRKMTLRPVELITTPKGETVIDMGQNMVGWLKFTVRGEKGHTLSVRHGEVLDKDGNFYNENYRSAKSEIIYTLKGEGEETFEPSLSFYGFRYVKLIDWPCEISLDDFEGVVVYSDMALTSGFECSDARVNRLFMNVQWGQRGNFVDIPTDCPQRDERVGWTGDCQAFARTACINMDSRLVLKKWLGDLKLDQAEDGGVPHVVPRVFSKPRNFGSSAWGDAATIVPWTLYLCYGDRRILAHQYPSMRKWLNYIDSQSENYIWCGGSHFGDWPGLDAPEGSYLGSTDKALIATAFSAYSTRLTMKTAQILGYDEDAKELSGLLEQVISAFRKKYVTEEGLLTVRTQTAYVLALHFDLIEESGREKMLCELLRIIEERGGHLSTGFVGTPYICLALTGAGAHDAAGRLLMQSEYPSWLYSVSKGATTMWEHWDGVKPDGSFWSSDMNSYNHYAYGAIGEWMMRKLAGIDLAAPAYRKISLLPMPIEGLSHVSAWQETPYGRIECEWTAENGKRAMRCVIPAGTTAQITLETAKLDALTADVDLKNAAQTEAGVEFALGSGEYRFEWEER